MAIFPLGGSPLPSAHETTPQPQASDPIQAAWADYTKHIHKWFFNPDLEAVQVTLAAAASHFHKDCDPLWLFILGPSGGDKCLAAGTPVLMHNGEVKKVEDIHAGDLLMGDDSTPRRVLSLASGNDWLYKISQEDGTTYTVNHNHILTLRMMVASGEYVTIDIPLQTYLRAGRLYKELLHGYNAAVEFPERDLDIPPYVLGCWLGDGTSESSGFTSADQVVIDRLNLLVAPMGLSCVLIKTKRPNQITYNISSGRANAGIKGSNPLLTALRKLKLLGNKHIPYAYLRASKAQRMQLLAGLIDTDGSTWGGAETGYMIVQKREQLSKDICWLARSLGYTAYIKPYKGKWTYKGVSKEGTYFRIIIAGFGADKIPVSLEHKKINPRQKGSKAAHCQLTVTKLDMGAYYGFELDGNGRFLLGDCTVTHNTSLCINSLLDLPQVHMQGELTAKTFLSGYTGTAHPSLLHKIGDGILAFKDFTTFTSKRLEEQAEIASQLREIYDGSFVKNTGKGVTIAWKGKITVIAAATPALERAWSSRRDLGERFLQVRISRKDGMQQSEYAQRQRGFEEHISVTMRSLAREFFQMSPLITNPPPRLSPLQMTRVAAMAELVSHARGIVPRHQVTNAIIDLPQIENSGRMSKAIASLISNHAALFRRVIVEEDDLSIGRRVALNTIPSTRMLIIEGIPLSGAIGSDLLTLQTGLPESTVSYLIGDLEHLGVVKVQHNEVVANQISLTPQMAQLWRAAFLPPVEQPLVTGAVH